MESSEVAQRLKMHLASKLVSRITSEGRQKCTNMTGSFVVGRAARVD